MARSTAKIDWGEIEEYARRLELASQLIEEEGEDFEEEWGGRWADEMKEAVPYGPGDPVHLRDQIEQVEPGGITFGDAYWWRFLEYGTVKMAPQPFIGPTMKRIRTPAKKDAGERAMRLISRG